MRVFVTARTGTGGYISEPVTPYTDENGDLVTSRIIVDRIRPAIDGTPADGSSWSAIPFRFPPEPGGNRFFLVCADVDEAPTGTADLGNPMNAGAQSNEPPAPQRRALEQFIGASNNTLKGQSRREIARGLLPVARRGLWRAIIGGVLVDVHPEDG